MAWLAEMSRLLPLFVVIPLGLGFLCAVLEKFRPGPRLGDVLAVTGTLLLTLMAVSGLGLVAGGEPVVRWIGNWQPPRPMGINMVLDGLSGLLIVTINLVGFAATLFSVNYMRRFTSRGYFWSLFLIMIAAMNGLVLSGDMFNLYVWLEVAAISSYGLVAFGCEREELEASFKYLILGSIASTMVLFGIGLMYNQTGTLNMAQMARSLSGVGATGPVLIACAFFLMGFGLKSALVPFHAWLPDAHPSAPAPISAMLSGVLIKAAGVYSLCRVFFCIVGVTPAVAWTLIVLGTLSMVIGVFLAIGQMDFKRLLAYHSISQMGYVVLALGVGARILSQPDVTDAMVKVAGLAILGALFHLFNHATFKSLLFLTSGSIEQQTGTRILTEMGGLTKRMGLTSACCRVGALSIAGVPPFNGFFSKLMIIVALVLAGHYWLAAAAVFVSFMTLASFVKVQRYALGGKLPDNLADTREAPLFMCLGMLLLTVVCFAAGIGAMWLTKPLLDPARNTLLSTPLDYAVKVLGPPGGETTAGTTREVTP